jgi:PhzF family phenazine biosynthesis protein
VELHRLSAFTTDPAGGNPAGVALSDVPLPPERMQQVAAEVGFSETAFLVPAGDSDRWDVRYFAPEAEVTFCGHATIAAGVLLGHRRGPGTVVFATAAGDVPVRIHPGEPPTATLTSVPPSVAPVSGAVLRAALQACGWDRDVLDPALPPAISFAGARHLVVPVVTRELLAGLVYDFDRLRGVMAAAQLTTTAVVWREDPLHWHARNPFPVGGVVEDPATGAAAAAVGAWLRANDLVDPPATVHITQGVDMGRPSQLTVDVPPGVTGIAVTGAAVPIP